MAAGWDTPGAVPLPPKNMQVVSPFVFGMLDVRWDDPAILTRNTGFTLVGVNVYRSEASDRGPFRRINEFPVGGTFYRDRTNYARVEREAVRWADSWVFKGDAPNDRRWVFRTLSPIAKRYESAPHQKPNYADSPTDVQFYINGVELPVSRVFGPSNEVTLINADEWDVSTETAVPAPIPTAADVVEVSYYTPQNHVRSGLENNLWYRVASVAVDATTPSGYIETPLEWCEPHSVIEVETLDYIWREAMRRNAWILQQGGERVKLFVRKTAGIPCDCCIDDKTLAYSKQPSSRCLDCFGTGFLGGYEGPYEVIIVPDDAERRIAQAVGGRNKEHTYEVWMGPSPLLTQRDFIVKQTNERYSVGPVRRPSHRGNLMQQHFSIAYFDQGDIRYRVPIDGTTELAWPETRGQNCVRTFTPRPVDQEMSGPAPWPYGPEAQHPMLTEKAEICDKHERRGRTRVWENTEYGILWWVLVSSALTVSGAFHAISGLL
jgi:hypothetical protein